MSEELRRTLRCLRSGRLFDSPAMTITRCRLWGRDVAFCTDRDADPIQRNMRKGRYYEQSELKSVRDYLPDGGTFVDIGANIGNHTLFFALHGGAGRVVPFEPNPVAWRLLIQNVIANRLLDVVSLDQLGVGLSDTAARDFGVEERERNIGASRMIPGGGAIEVRVGDDALSEETPALIKIDVEGMELSVLRGLTKTLARARPALHVEVDNANEEAFFAWAESARYRHERTWQRYKLNKNHLMLPA